MLSRSVLIIGNYGAGNLGDDAILGGILTDLRAMGFSGRIRVTHGGTKSSRDIYKGLELVPFVPSGLRSRFRSESNQALQAIRESDLIILGGGGLFTDAESRRAPYIWATQAKAAHKLKKPYICYGQSVGPLKTFLGRFWAKRTFKNAKAIHVRDEASAQLLKKWRLKATVGTDPAFSWLLPLQRQLQLQKKQPRKPVLMVSLRLWPGHQEKTWEPLLKEIKVFAKRKHLKPILMAMDTRNVKEIEALKRTKMEVFEPQSALEAFEGFEKSTLGVTMRLHACIFALASRTPFIALAYSQKVSALFPKSILTGGELRDALKGLSLKPSLSDLESPLSQNQAFLARQLADL